MRAIARHSITVALALYLTRAATLSVAADADAALLARARSLELNTSYVPPPGDPLVHHAAGFAQIMC